MFNDEVRRKLENIIQGNVIQEQPDSCATIRNQLCASFATSTTVKKDFESKQLIKEEQARFLQELATTHNFWIKEVPANWTYLTHGGEAKIYLHSDQIHVVKLNDAVTMLT